MTVRRRTQISVSIKWRGKYAILRWREPNGQGRPERGLGYVTPEEAEEARAEKEAELRLGLAPRPSETGFGGYTVAALACDYLEAIEASPTGEDHKRRTALDCEALGRILGAYLVESLTTHHVGRFVALRSKERVIRARQRKGEPDEAWEARRAASRGEQTGKPVSSTTIKGELATLRRAVTWGRNAGKHRAPALSGPSRNAMPEDQRPARKLTEAEARRLVDGAGAYRLLVELEAWSGRRPVALFGARVSDCVRVMDDTLPRKERQMFWRRDKGGRRTGWGKLTDPAYEAIRRRVQELGDVPGDTLLWTQPNGKPWASSTWPKRFAKIAAAAGVPNVVFYDLRKHACAQLLRALGNAHEAIEYSGHKTVETFMKNYAYALDDGDGPAPRIGWRPAPLRILKENESNE